MSVLKKLLSLMSPKERRRGCLLLFMILVMAFLDTAGVASIMPFMAVIGTPDVVFTNEWLNKIYIMLDFSSPKDFMFFLGVAVFSFLVLSIIFKALTQWGLLRFTEKINCSLSCKMFEGYLGRPYSWFLNRHSADLGKTVLSEASQVISACLMPAIQFLAHGTVALFLIFLLVIVDPILALCVSLVLGGSYTIVYLIIRKYLSRIGEDRVLANTERFQIAQEALGGIKEVKIFGREFSFFLRFVNPSSRFARHQANFEIASLLPKYLLEIVSFGGILLIVLYLFKIHGDFNRVLPILAVYALAGYRLLPAMQNVYRQITNLRFGQPALDKVYSDILEIQENEYNKKEVDCPPIIPKQNIRLENICFTYPGAHAPTLKNLNLKIPVRSTIGLVGTTGSGKSTTVDVIMGLLSPQSGQLYIDNTPIFTRNSFSPSINSFRITQNQTIRSWQRVIGYVPQNIYLADQTIAANIAFGIPENEIDIKSVIRAAQIAELHEFVSNSLPKGYDTLVGEQGVRLSGGQRQRIGIARALYHDPAVLIFDEATSALDNLTEYAVMLAINNLGRAKTIIIIAHRLTTVRNCDQIYVLEFGELVGQGNYDELAVSNERFRRNITSDRSVNDCCNTNS